MAAVNYAALCRGEHTLGVPLASHGVPDEQTVRTQLKEARGATAEGRGKKLVEAQLAADHARAKQLAAQETLDAANKKKAKAAAQAALDSATQKSAEAQAGLQRLLAEAESSGINLDESDPWSAHERRKELGTATVDYTWFQAKVQREAELQSAKLQNHLDFWKKYSGGVPEIDLGTPLLCWALVFTLPPAGDIRYINALELDAEQGASETAVARAVELDESPQQFMCDEAVELVQRFWDADLYVKMETSIDKTECHILVGAPYEILIDEANVVRPQMRMVNCKGTTPFQSDKLSNYAPSLFVAPDHATCFTSALQQKLVYNRMERIAGVHLDERLNYLPRDEGMALIKKDIAHHHAIRASRVRELLSTHGGFRPGAESIFGTEVVMLGKQVVADPFFKCAPDHRLSKKELAILHAEEEHMRARGLDVLKYEQIETVVEILANWTSKLPGSEEEFTGSLISYFPLHAEAELAYLKSHWGSYHLILQPWIKGKSAEAPGTGNYFKASLRDRHFTMFWVPIDTIRDYFGDHVGLYSAWLCMYTKSLIWPALVGLIIQMYSSSQGDVDVDNNVLVIPYSVWLSLWSATFNILWLRRQNELKVLWGSEHEWNLESGNRQVRPQFEGRLMVDDLTHQEWMTYTSSCDRATRLLISALVSFTCVAGVIFAAFVSISVRYIDTPHPDSIYCLEYLEGTAPILINGTTNFTTFNFSTTFRLDDVDSADDCATAGTLVDGNSTVTLEAVASSIDGFGAIHHVDDVGVVQTTWVDGWPAGTSQFDRFKWRVLGSGLTVFLILTFGFIYEKIAVSMTDWENHRTQLEYENNLILKNFGFQFVNNYFILFYHMYMRQIDTSIIGGPDPAITECKTGTCLSEVQFQVALIFTAQLVLSQLAEIFAPRLKAVAHKAKGALGIRKLQNAARAVRDKAAQTLLSEDMQELLHEDEDHLAHEKVKRERQEERNARMAAATSGDLDTSKMGQVERESYLLDYASTFDDFNEMAIQFGYLALFSPVYPLACVCALLNNILEIRVDAAKVCRVSRRPSWQSEDNIGSWFAVINLIGFVAVATNVTMVVFVGKLFAGSDEEAEGGLAMRIKSWHLWGLCVGIEHVLLTLRVIIIQGLPTTPSWIDEDVRRQLEWYRENAKPGLQIMAEQEQKHIFDDKYGVSGDNGETQKQSKADKRRAATEVEKLAHGSVFLNMTKGGFKSVDSFLNEAATELPELRFNNPIICPFEEHSPNSLRRSTNASEISTPLFNK